MHVKRAKTNSADPISIAARHHSLNGPVWRDLRTRGKEDPAFLAKLVALFVHDADQRLAAISAALANGSATECARAAHALATGCLQIGATNLAQNCLDIERATKGGATGVEPQLLQRVHDEYRLVRRELEGAVTSAGADT